jgi:hypothetical protein
MSNWLDETWATLTDGTYYTYNGLQDYYLVDCFQCKILIVRESALSNFQFILSHKLMEQTLESYTYQIQRMQKVGISKCNKMTFLVQDKFWLSIMAQIRWEER